MIDLFKSWYQRYLSDPQAVLLLVILIFGFTVILTMGDMLTPVLAAIVIAYLLESVVQIMQRHGSKRLTGVVSVWLMFVAFLMFLVFGMLPLFVTQVQEFIPEVGSYWSNGKQYLATLPQKYSFISEAQVTSMVSDLESLIGSLGKSFVDNVLGSITAGAIAFIVYIILLPLMVFFFLKDKYLILNWLGGFLPRDRQLAREVWDEMDVQLGNYIRGKIWEILIVGLASYITFAMFDLKYAFLLGVLVGLSVIVPYIGATLVTIPVAAVAFFQWGISGEFVSLLVAYLIIQALDGNLLVPFLFGNVVNVHPVAIIISILLFGGLWGFWGVFFAIPLATLVNALLRAWPRSELEGDPPAEVDAASSKADA